MAVRDERRARMGLASLGLPSDVDVGANVRSVGAVETWERLVADESGSLAARRASAVDLDEVEGETAYVGARFVIPDDPEWPAALDVLADHELDGTRNVPYGLWLYGLGLDPRRPVAITGARAATAYGTSIAEGLAADLAEAGSTVVTSLSFGIDVAAIQGAVAVEGMAPVVLLAGGLMSMRLSGHEHLVAELDQRATVLSEHAPSIVPSRSNFLARSRLLAALSEGTVVVEAAMRSGARTTAAWSRELGKPVMAMPGPITSCQSRMPHSLIRDHGAHLVESADEVSAVLARAHSSDQDPFGFAEPIERTHP